ncbi:hypothetical protein JCM1841_004391 [Sporobolomyces salmonicolor]
MAAVAWVVRDRAIEVVPYPLFYMDDQFGLDLLGETRLVEHDGKECWLPQAQAETLERLTITGLVVDLDTCTVTLEDKAIELFAVVVARFTDRSLSRQRPLREWHQIAGWAKWTLTVRPWARPLLSPLYAKLGRSNSPYAGLFINNDIAMSLAQLVADLCHGPPLDLRDDMLTEWEEHEAKLVVHTDVYDRLRRASVNIRVVHVSGSANVMADCLSRDPVDSLITLYRRNLYTFVTPPAAVGQVLTQ